MGFLNGISFTEVFSHNSLAIFGSIFWQLFLDILGSRVRFRTKNASLGPVAHLRPMLTTRGRPWGMGNHGETMRFPIFSHILIIKNDMITELDDGKILTGSPINFMVKP